MCGILRYSTLYSFFSRGQRRCPWLLHADLLCHPLLCDRSFLGAEIIQGIDSRVRTGAA